MNTIEETFVKTFIKRDRRQSWLQRLAAPKTRAKHVHRLAHTLDRELDERYMYDKARLPTQIAIQVEHLLMRWKKANPNKYVMSLLCGMNGMDRWCRWKKSSRIIFSALA